MKINPDFTIQKVGGAYVAVPVGETSKTFHAMIRLNETGAFLWNKLAGADLSESDLVDSLLASYEGVDRATAQADVRRIITLLSQNGILL